MDSKIKRLQGKRGLEGRGKISEMRKMRGRQEERGCLWEIGEGVLLDEMSTGMV